MADIISGKSRFNGDKNAPVKKIITINNEAETAATEEYEEDIQLRLRRHRKRVIIGAVLIIAAVAVVIYIFSKIMDNYSYSSYSISNSVDRDDTENTQYESYGDGYIRYSADGIAYFTSKGKAMWNQTFSMQKPQIKIRGNDVAIGDISGNKIYTFDKNGVIGSIDTSMTILQIEIASNGIVAAVLEDNDANYINMYDKDGSKIYSVKTTLAGDGYPLDISISEDATKLIASYVYVSGESIKTNVVFYNFSDVGQNETERVVGGFNHYADTLVGDVEFVNNNMAVAVGENVVSIYKIKEYPSLEKEIKVDNEIEKVFFSDQYIGLVVDNADSGEPYLLEVYNLSGNKMCEVAYSTQYTDVKFDGKSIVMNNSASMLLINLKGKKLATIDFDMPATSLITTGRRGDYVLVTSKYIQAIKLK